MPSAAVLPRGVAAELLPALTPWLEEAGLALEAGLLPAPVAAALGVTAGFVGFVGFGFRV